MRNGLRVAWLAISLASLACANRIDEQLPAARTTADVTALVGSAPECEAVDAGFRACTWRVPSFQRSGCTGYAECGSARHKASNERVVSCRVDGQEHVTACQARMLR